MPVKWNTTIKEATFTFGAGSTSRAWKLDLVLLRRKRTQPILAPDNLGNFELIGDYATAGTITTAPNTIIGSMTVSENKNAGATMDLLAALGANTIAARTNTLQELVKAVTAANKYALISQEVFKSENIYLGLNVTVQATTAVYTGSAMITITTVEATPAALGTKATYKAIPAPVAP
jgi:hypothetical protein